MLLAGINSILNVFQYKRLDWRECRCIIQAVVTSKALYYLNVTPLTDAELDTLDRRIARQFKRTLHMSKSTSSHILYMPEEERGFSLGGISPTHTQVWVWVIALFMLLHTATAQLKSEPRCFLAVNSRRGWWTADHNHQTFTAKKPHTVSTMRSNTAERGAHRSEAAA